MSKLTQFKDYLTQRARYTAGVVLCLTSMFCLGVTFTSAVYLSAVGAILGMVFARLAPQYVPASQAS